MSPPSRAVSTAYREPDTPEQRSRPPVGNQRTTKSRTLGGGRLDTILSPDAFDAAAPPSWEMIRERVNGAFVLAVTRSESGRSRRQMFLSASGAESACQRAIARGESAVVVLCELRPLFRVTDADGETLPVLDGRGTE